MPLESSTETPVNLNGGFIIELKLLTAFICVDFALTSEAAMQAQRSRV